MTEKNKMIDAGNFWYTPDPPVTLGEKILFAALLGVFFGLLYGAANFYADFVLGVL